jgi:hypothetical protein
LPVTETKRSQQGCGSRIGNARADPTSQSGAPYEPGMARAKGSAVLDEPTPHIAASIVAFEEEPALIVERVRIGEAAW